MKARKTNRDTRRKSKPRSGSLRRKGASTKVARKTASRQRSSRLRIAVPPPDNPLLRHEELDADRHIVETATAATGGRGRGRGGARNRMGAAASAAGGEVSQMARLRLYALEESRDMPEAFEGGRPRAAVVPGSAAAATGIELAVPVAGISNWVQMGPTAIPNGQTYGGARVLVTGRITAICIDPTNANVIYVGTAQGGVWKTTDGGKNWVAKSDNEVSLAIGALAMDPANPQILYAGTGEGNFSGDSYYGAGVLKSINGGNSWTLFPASPATTFVGKRFSRIAVTPGTPTRLFGAVGDGVYRSTDSGATWSLVSGLGFGAATDVVIDPATPTTVYASIWAGGIWKSTNTNAATPTWTKLTGGLPTSGFTRIALGISPTSPQTLYALIANNSYSINQFYRTTDGGTTWTAIALPSGSIGGQGFYNINVAVDPTTPDIVFLSGISVWKATRNTMTGVWTITEVGAQIHPDNHAFAFHPANHLIVFAGNDGGIYKSVDAGATWDDSINEGPCITQFEFISQHPTSDAVVFGGTQDNGTEQFRNSPVFYHADDGDGGYCLVDQTDPKNVISTYYGPSPKRSTQAGKFGTWFTVSSGIDGSGLFYPPLAADDTNPNNVAMGTDRINLDAAQGTGGWSGSGITLPSMAGFVSAIHYVNNNLIYCGTTAGRAYVLRKSGSVWTPTLISASPLPGQFIWDIIARPGASNVVFVVMAGFGISHVWRGDVPASGTATWTNISGTGIGTTLPDIPVNALAIEPAAPDTMYIATDVAVYRTTNAGTTWTQFSQGLPNCAVFDLKLHDGARVLRAGTHGRGLWERRLDATSMPDVDLYFRDHLMHTGRQNPSPSNVPAAFEDPLQYVNLGDSLHWWMCADIKVDALEGTMPSYQMNVANVDYVAYEARLQHRNAQRGNVNRVYVQVHNRGITAGSSVVVKLLFANASAGLPPLPNDFWTAFPNNSSNTTVWTPIGLPKTILSVPPAAPVILEWDWATPTSAADHTCLLVVMDCPSNPIPAANKVLNVNTLVHNEKRVGLKNLHVVNAPPGASLWSALGLHAFAMEGNRLRVLASSVKGWRVGVVLPKSAGTAKALGLEGITASKPTAATLKALKEKLGAADYAKYDVARLYTVTSAQKGGRLSRLKISKEGLRAMLLFTAPKTGASEPEKVTLVQEDANGVVVGGNTFVLRTVKKG